MAWLTAARRKALYALAGAVAALLAFYGVLQAEAVPIVLGVVYAALNAMAASFVTPDDDVPPTDVPEG